MATTVAICDQAEVHRALGEAYTELLYAAAELRSAASRDDVNSRALLYTLADRLEIAAVRLQGEPAEETEPEDATEPATQDSRG